MVPPTGVEPIPQDFQSCVRTVYTKVAMAPLEGIEPSTAG